jgi:hypothetical protein
MNIEKIKNYNQKMLAALSTILVVMAAIGLISLIVVLIGEIIPHGRNFSNTILSEKKVEKLKQDSLRMQIVSYSSPELVDTANLIYIISANVRTLDNPESYNADTELLDMYDSGDSFSMRKSPSKRIYGTFINLLEYDYKNNSTKKICNERIVGTDLSFENFKDEIIIVFKASSQDTDGDGIISPEDFNSLFIYSLKDKQLHKIEFENSTVESFEYIENTKDLLITFGFDRNNNKRFEKNLEPTIIMKYDYKNSTLVKIVDKVLESEIQNILDNK